jgi:hypothetical protein
MIHIQYGKMCIITAIDSNMACADAWVSFEMDALSQVFLACIRHISKTVSYDGHRRDTLCLLIDIVKNSHIEILQIFDPN